MDSWRNLNPNWQYIFWDASRLREYFPNGLRNQEQFDDIREWCGKCDVARIEILNAFGGLFIDADSICLRPLDDYLLENDSFSCYENEFACGQLVACGYLASTVGNSLMELMMEEIGRLDIPKILNTPLTSAWDTSHQAWQITGGALLTKSIFQNKYSAISIYPSYYFIPEHYSGHVYRGKGKPYCRQLWASTVGSKYYGYVSPDSKTSCAPNFPTY